jgi:iron(III) transport system ATP-binding protein
MSYGATPVLRGVDLTVGAGEFTAVLGPSGSGKTTLLRLLAGFARADGGTIELGGRTVQDERRATPPERRRIGYVPQDGALFPHLTVRANIAFGLSRAQRRSDRVGELLDLIGLRPFAEYHPHQLSGGQQQRVALARALAPSPDLVLLDEPFSALDASLRATVRADVLAILRATSCTAILVTHDQGEALSMADRIAVLREGRVVQHATARELYEHPADSELASFVGEASFLRATLTPEGVDLGELGVLPPRAPVAGLGTATALIRPEQIAVVAADRNGAGASLETPPGAGAGAASVRGVVERCDYFGHDMLLTVRPHWRAAAAAAGAGVEAGKQLPETVLARLAGDAPISAGTAVSVSVRGPIVAWPSRSP